MIRDLNRVSENAVKRLRLFLNACPLRFGAATESKRWTTIGTDAVGLLFE